MAGIVARKKHGAKRGGRMAFVALVALVIAAAALSTRRRPAGEGARPGTPPAPAAVEVAGIEKPGEAKPSSAQPGRAATAPAEAAEPAPAPAPKREGLPDYVPDDYMPKPGQMVLPNGKVMTFPPPEPGKPRMLVAGGRTWECDSEGNFRDVTPRQLFKTAFEANFLAMSVEGRSFIPACLTGLDKDDVVAMLTKEYVPIGDETEHELEQLAAYEEMRAAALAYIEEGGDFDDFVADINSFVQAERRIRARSLKKVMMLYNDGRIDEAKAEAAALDDALASQGYRPLRLPPRVREAFGE